MSRTATIRKTSETEIELTLTLDCGGDARSPPAWASSITCSRRWPDTPASNCTDLPRRPACRRPSYRRGLTGARAGTQPVPGRPAGHRPLRVGLRAARRVARPGGGRSLGAAARDGRAGVRPRAPGRCRHREPHALLRLAGNGLAGLHPRRCAPRLKRPPQGRGLLQGPRPGPAQAVAVRDPAGTVPSTKGVL